MDTFTIAVTLPGTAEHFVRTCEGTAIIGRSDDCTVQLAHPLVSRHHMQVAASAADDGFVVRDLGSRNGTIVNGHTLRDDQSVVRGEVTIQVGPYMLMLTPPSTSDAETVLFDVRNTTTRVALDRGAHAVLVDGAIAIERLSALEYRLMDALAAASPNLVENKVLGDAVWEAGQWDSYMLHNLIRRVRRKLEEHTTGADDLISTVPGVGYRLA